MIKNLNKKHWLILLTLALVIILGIAYFNNTKTNAPIKSNSVDQTQLEDRELVSLTIGEAVMTVEVVNSTESIVLGLSGRSEIGSNGMLFIFGSPQSAGFWMKEMQFDLDMVWIAENKVVGITKNVPHPDPSTPLNELPTYPAPQPVNMVLEIPAGTAEELSINVGDEVSITR